MLIKGFRYLLLLQDYRLALISSIRLDGGKNFQPVKSPCSICIQSFDLASYHLLRGIIKDLKQTHVIIPQISQFSCIFNEYETQRFSMEFKN